MLGAFANSFWLASNDSVAPPRGATLGLSVATHPWRAHGRRYLSRDAIVTEYPAGDGAPGEVAQNKAGLFTVERLCCGE